jgi:hypothetical protein
MATKISKKAAKRIAELFNELSVVRMFTDEANVKTPEGRAQWLRWMNNGIKAARELQDDYGIVLPYWSDVVSSDEAVEKATGYMRMLVEADKQQADSEYRARMSFCRIDA